MGIQNYEQISQFTLDDKLLEELLQKQTECSIVWNTKEGWPTGCIMAFVYRQDRFWLTAAEQRARIAALRRDERCSLIISSLGTSLGPVKTATIKGRCRLRKDDETKAWLYPAIAKAQVPFSEDMQKIFAKRLDSPNRVILEVEPMKWMTFDAMKMFMDSAEGGI